MRATVFLGGGRITSALIAGLRLANYTQPIIVHDRHPEKLRALKKQCKIATEANLRRAVTEAGLLIVAVRPDSIRELLNEIGNVNRPLLAVSVAAGIPLSDLRAGLGPPVKWARTMPSPVSRIGQGLIGVAFPAELSARDRRAVSNFFAHFGVVIEVPEAQFDIFTATYSCSHGYHALATLARAAEKLGLDHNIALTAAAHALADGIFSWRQGNVPLEDLLEEAATPGGIAATVMATMDKGRFQALVETSLRAGVARARANSRLVKATGTGATKR
ncbi:MAG TPA: NAD(P)-binding domain-containing protein [Terriglobales bacterium]|nr:NAD(P)-binding domain-containing protein [Terriglobales bacterium]